MARNRDLARLAGTVGCLLSMALAAIAIHGVHAQAPPAAGASPAFDVVTIRQNNTNAGPRGVRWAGSGRLEVRGFTLREIVRFAYDPTKYQVSQVVGGPEWLDGQRFDIDAVGKVPLPAPAPGSNSPPPVLLTLMRGMLETRFKLQAGEAAREIEYLALTRARADALGPQLKARATCRPQAPNVAPDAETCNLLTATPGLLTARAVDMDRVVVALAAFPQITKLVRNETGLTGMYDIDMTYVPGFINVVPGGKPVPNPNAGSGPDVFQAFEQQLGLKLDERRGPIDVVVIEGAQMP